jgi:hypothetical protein
MLAGLPWQVMEYAATHYNATFVLKTDDDAFINVSPLLEQLRALCENPGCASERLYMGKMAKHSEVLLQPGHKWNNAAFHNHTGEQAAAAAAVRRCRAWPASQPRLPRKLRARHQLLPAAATSLLPCPWPPHLTPSRAPPCLSRCEQA